MSEVGGSPPMSEVGPTTDTLRTETPWYPTQPLSDVRPVGQTQVKGLGDECSTHWNPYYELVRHGRRGVDFWSWFFSRVVDPNEHSYLLSWTVFHRSGTESRTWVVSFIVPVPLLSPTWTLCRSS